MASVTRRQMVLGAGILLLLALGVATCTLRGHLAHVPLLGRLAPMPDAAGGAGMASTMGIPATGTAAGSGASGGDTPRAAITIDPRRQQLIGVRTAAVERRPLATTVRTVGVVRYDETRVADVNLKIEGWIRDLYVNTTGAFVEVGQPLFTLYSPELVTTQNEYLLALQTRDQLRQSPLADAREHAERLVQAARQRLTLWDLPADQLAALEQSGEPQTALVFRSPVTGSVIEKQAVEGMHVTPGQKLYTVANLSTVWVEADVYERDLPRVRVGAAATVTLDAYPGERFTGRVLFVYPFVDEQTRTVKVRLAFANRGTRLKPGMYANVELRSAAGSSLVIPTNALLDSGREQIVFVAQGDGYFEPRQVRVGQRTDDAVEILGGLAEGESVAAGAAFFLDSESQLRSSLQAFEAAPAAGESPAPRDGVSIAFRSQPDPLQSGENRLEAVVTAGDGAPVTDAEVTVVFFMAAMPTMNMPAMRNQASLTHAGGGVYRGIGQVMMAGRWDVTIDVRRDGQRLGSRQLSVVAR